MPPSPESFAFPSDRLPTVRTAGEYTLDDRGFETRYLSKTHALHLYDFAATLRLGGRVLTLAPGDLTLTPAGVRSGYDLPEPGRHLCIHFHLPKASARPPGPRFEAALHAPLSGDAAYAAEQIRRIVAHHAAADTHPTYAPSASAVLLGLLLWLSRRGQTDTPARATEAQRCVAQAARLIEDNLHEPFTVPELAREVGLSQNYLAQCFRQRFGMTIPRYLLQRRVALAEQLLIGSDLPVKVIGQRVGMPDPQHFNKQFRNLTGTSPSAYRAAGSARGDA